MNGATTKLLVPWLKSSPFSVEEAPLLMDIPNTWIDAGDDGLPTEYMDWPHKSCIGLQEDTWIPLSLTTRSIQVGESTVNLETLSETLPKKDAHIVYFDGVDPESLGKRPPYRCDQGLLTLSIEGAEALLAIWKSKIGFHLHTRLTQKLASCASATLSGATSENQIEPDRT